MTRGLAAVPERLEGRSRYSSLSPNGRPSGVSAAEEGPTASILKGPVQFSESFFSRTLSSVLFRNPWWIVAAVCMYMYVWSSHIAEYDQPGEVANPARGQLNKED